ncbi:MAG: RNA methyltransferase [Polyangiaceae bacterium]|nr:RNA methyltransferase [Polyangiaceae bacterium]
MRRRIALALVHHPVLDRSAGVITTAITNLDLHDMSRSACAFGLSDMFVVHPIAAQRELVERVRDHWLLGSGSRRIPDRAPPMRLLRVVDSIEHVCDSFDGGRSGIEIWTTSAKAAVGATTYAQARERVTASGPPVVVLFGTGWGLTPALVDSADVRLEPIRAVHETGFNHLSVRAACAITLDRLLGAR